ncbi:uncharacterized protein LOC103986972 isoform X1 [Musa acuminata AAA Group]
MYKRHTDPPKEQQRQSPSPSRLISSPVPYPLLFICLTFYRSGVEKMSRRAGDWNCSLCQHHNFSRRDSCQQCGHPRLCSGDFSDYAGLGGGRGGSSFGVVSDVRPGDWYCSCGGHNFASRSSCHSCGAFRDESAVGVIGGFDNSEMAGSQGITYGGGGWKSGDWLCTRSGCNHHNFASRRECYRCKAPKGCGA